MHCIRPCPSCSINLRIPLDGGILHIRCPNCDYRFVFYPEREIENTEFPTGWDNKSASTSQDFYGSQFKPEPPSWNLNSLSLTHFSINRIITLILFSILALYIIRGCLSWEDSPIPENNTIEETPPSEEPINTPFSI